MFAHMRKTFRNILAKILKKLNSSYQTLLRIKGIPPKSTLTVNFQDLQKYNYKFSNQVLYLMHYLILVKSQSTSNIHTEPNTLLRS